MYALRSALAIALVGTGVRTAVAGAAGTVTLDGMIVPKAMSSINASIDVTEFRDGTGGGCPRLLPGCARAQVCLNSPGLVAPLDAQLDQSNGISQVRFTVGVEDGRQFARCLLVKLTVEGAGARRRYVYCLDCEGMTAAPAP